MSLHYCQDSWIREFRASIQNRLPKSYEVLVYHPLKPNSVKIQVRKECKGTYGSGRWYIGRNLTKSIAWAACSPYNAASIFLYHYFATQSV